MNKYHLKKKNQLGMDAGTASSQLRKTVLFDCIKRLGEDICHRCSKKIETVEDLSIDHIVPWLDTVNPRDMFFDLENITFSHLGCNAGAARKLSPRTDWLHGTTDGYKTYKCRCDRCREAVKLHMREWRSRKR